MAPILALRLGHATPASGSGGCWRQAPTGGNSQGWRWLVVTDPELRAGLADPAVFKPVSRQPLDSVRFHDR